MTFDWTHLHLMDDQFPVILGLVGAALIALVAKRDVVTRGTSQLARLAEPEVQRCSI